MQVKRTNQEKATKLNGAGAGSLARLVELSRCRGAFLVVEHSGVYRV
jgi:hypothetical protein